MEYKKVEGAAVQAATEMRAEFWSTSSKSGQAVQELFIRMAAVVFDTLMVKEEKEGDNVQIGEQLDS